MRADQTVRHGRAAMRRGTSLALAVALVGGLVASCAAPYASARHHYGAGNDYPGAASHPTAAEQAATLVATQGYRRLLLDAVERLSSSATATSRDAAAGRLQDARRDELAAQAAYDQLRAGIAPASATADQLDGEEWVTPGGMPDGLHAVEQALWKRADLPAAARLASAVAAHALVSGFLFYRTTVGPSEVLSRSKTSLAWVVAVPLVGREELYSHLDLVDVAATVAAARAGYLVTAPLGRIVAPSATALAAERFARLDLRLRRLGTPSMHPDGAIARATWRSIAVDVDAVSGALGSLAGSLAGFGTGRTYA